MWNIWIRSAMTVCSGLEIVWVVVDRETKLRNARKVEERDSGPSGAGDEDPGEGSSASGAENGGESSTSSNTKMKGKGKAVQRKKAKGFDDTHISSRSSTWERVEVRLVENVTEIFAEVEARAWEGF